MKFNALHTHKSTIKALSKYNLHGVANEYQKLLGDSKINSDIPTFYHNHKTKKLTFTQKYKSNILYRSLMSLKNCYPTKEDISFLRKEYSLLNKNGNKAMTYLRYLQLRQKCPKKLQKTLSSQLFVEIGGYSMHTINAEELFKHLELISWCVNHYIKLRSYGEYISITDLKKYISETCINIPVITYYRSKEPNFVHIFSEYASQRLQIELDTLNCGKISLFSLFNSSIFSKYVLLGTYLEDIKQNPFSLSDAYSSYLHFKVLDSNNDGIIDANDLINTKQMSFTSTFITRLFETYGHEGCGNFMWFLRFKLSWNNIGCKWANSYFFPIMDIDGDDKISQSDINYFYNEIFKHFINLYPINSVPSINIISNEYFDMYGAQNQNIPKELFVESEVTQQFVTQLADFNIFMRDALTDELM